MKHIKFTAFDYDELSPKAKDVAVARFIELHVKNVPIEQWEPEHRKVAEEINRQQNPWGLIGELYQNHRPKFEEALKSQEFLFYADGSIVSLTEGLEISDARSLSFKPKYQGRTHPLDIVCEARVEDNEGEGGAGYTELTVTFKTPDGAAIADVFIGLSDDGHTGATELRILSSADSNPDEHRISVYPERALGDRVVNTNWQ